MRNISFLLVILLATGVSGCSRTPIANGEALVRQLWTDFSNCDEAVLEQWMAPGFQSVHPDGARTRMEELELLLGLQLGDYVLDDFHSTQTKEVIVVTYSVSVRETIEGKIFSKNPAQRMSVFIYDDNNWKWLAHANLHPM